MHPITKQNFGVNGIAVQFINGTKASPGSSTLGYIVKQSGTDTFVVTDGTMTNTTLNTWSVKFVSPSVPSVPYALSYGYCTIEFTSGTSTVTPTYILDTVSGITNAGNGYTVHDVVTLAGTGATLTVTTISGETTGPITGVQITSNGSTLSAAVDNPVAVTGGTGTGATFNLTYKITSIATSSGVVEHVSGIWSRQLVTYEGGRYYWSTNLTVPAVGGSVILPTYS